MKCAADYRKIARESLAEKWGTAVLGGFLASVLGAVSSFSVDFSLLFEENPFENWSESGTADADTPIFGALASALNEPLTEEVSRLLAVLGTVVFVAIGIGIVLGIAWSILASVIRLGYCRFNLDLIERQEKPEIGTIFQYFSHWKTAFCTSFLEGLYVILWALLLIIPGFVAAYSYVMTGYILAEEPELTAREAIARSKELMRGNRWRYFCLELSFIGWEILCAFTMGIGQLWLIPYRQAAYAAFYRDLSRSGMDRNLPM